MILRRMADGIDERLDGSSFIRHNLRKVFPDHWSFMLGEIALYSFALLLLTGIFLSLFYVASPAGTTYQGPYLPMAGREVSLAYDSVMRLSFEVRAGLVMRQAHHWAALVFMAAIVAHMLRIFFTGAFRKPRELSWVLGIGLLVGGTAAGFTGYSLPDDLLSGTGLRIIYSGVLSIPVVGTWLAFLLFGGPFPSAELLPRLFVLHVFLIPAMLVAGIGAHLALVWHQTHTQFRPRGTGEDTVTGTPVWPKFALKGIGLAFMTFAAIVALGGLVQINPVWLYGPFVPYTASSPAQPDFYAGWLEGLLRLWPNWEFHVFGYTIGELFLPAVVVPGVIFTLLALWPFIEARVSGDHDVHHDAQHPREAPVRSGIGAAGIAFFTLLMLAGSNDVLAKYLQVEVDTLNAVLKVLLFVMPLIAGLVTWAICRDLGRRGQRPMEAPERVRFIRNAAGGFEEVPDPVKATANTETEPGDRTPPGEAAQEPRGPGS
jgi:ubiquinol-cytochrome c reductase cytochrome b subunit